MSEELHVEGDFLAWLTAVSLLYQSEKSAEEWRFVERPTLFSTNVKNVAAKPSKTRAAVPPALERYFRYLSSHDGDGRWQTLWQLFVLLQSKGRAALNDACDGVVREARKLERELNYEQHKMKAYLRFHRDTQVDDDWFGSSYPCRFDMLPWTANFFVDRFRGMRWYIQCHGRLAVWDGSDLAWRKSPAIERQAPADVCEDLWITYYRSTYNEARHNPRLFRQHVPKRFWGHLTEGAEMQRLLHTSNAFGKQMPSTVGSDGVSYASCSTLAKLREASSRCDRCDLCQIGTQIVHGEGNPSAPLMIVGEQPGDEEDRHGRPFVGPAGRLLRRLLREVDIDDEDIYLTNAVKHFNHIQEAPGKPRLHKRPSQTHVNQCRSILLQEIAIVRPTLILCLGATAARALLGRPLNVSEARNKEFRLLDRPVRVTFHPAAILRSDDFRATKLEQVLKDDLHAAYQVSVKALTHGDESRQVSEPQRLVGPADPRQ